MKTYSIPLKSRSAKSDYSCPDGEIAGALNLTFVNGSLTDGSLTGSNPVIDGVESELLPPAVEFALRQGVVPGWHIHPDMLPSQIMDAPSVGKGETPTESDWGARALQAVAAFEEDAMRHNLFTQPFLVMAAWRLTDGSHAAPTKPVMMIPNSGAPVVEGSSDFSVPTMKMNVIEAACSLQWKLKIDGEAISPKSPILNANPKSPIAGIDIFVSEPISLYDPKEQAKGYHRFECTNFTRSIGADGSDGDRMIYGNTIVQGWKAPALEAGYVAYKFNRVKTFSKIAAIDVADMGSTEGFQEVVMADGCLKVLWTMEAYAPEFTINSEDETQGITDDSWKDFIPSDWNVDSDDFTTDGEWSVFVTRPLKLDEPEGRKQVTGVTLRGVYDRREVSMALYGSENLMDWRLLVRADCGVITGLWSTKSRFFRLAVKTRHTFFQSIQALAITLRQ